MKKSAFARITDLTARYPALADCVGDVADAVDTAADCVRAGGKILVCGNGGSASDSEHIVGELMKSFVLKRKLPEEELSILKDISADGEYIYNNLQGAVPCISLVNEAALCTAYANDCAPDLGFAQQVYGLGNGNDVLIGISTSGNSKNVIYAAQTAKLKGMKVIGLTGEKEARLDKLCDVCIKVPASETFKIQEYHLPVYHAFCLALEEEFFGE